MKANFVGLVGLIAVALAAAGLQRYVAAQAQGGSEPLSTIRLKTTEGWITADAFASGATFSVDGKKVTVDAGGQPPVTITPSADGMLTIERDGISYEAPSLRMRSGSTVLVNVTTTAGANVARKLAAPVDEEESHVLPADRIRVVGEGPLEQETPVAPPNEPAAATPKKP